MVVRRLGVALLAMMAMILLLGVMPASAGCGQYSGDFCAYRDSQYGHLELDSHQRTIGSNVDVRDNVVSSGKNGMSDRYWWGMDEHTFLPDECVFYWAPNTLVPYVGNSANDKIDHFAVKGGSC